MSRKSSLLLCLILLLVFVSNSVFASNITDANIKQDIEILAGKKLSIYEKKEIEKEMDALKSLINDVSIVEEIHCDDINEYILNYGVTHETVVFNEINDSEIAISVTDGEKKDTCTLTKDGQVFINGNKVQYTNEYVPYGSAWKSTYKGTKPYGSLKTSSYNKYLSSSRSNAGMEDKIKNITYTALGIALARLVPFANIGVDIANMVGAFLRSANPNSYYVSCTYDTYTCGAADYQYRTKVYATGNYTGSYKSVNTYEHFLVY